VTHKCLRNAEPCIRDDVVEISSIPKDQLVSEPCR